MRVCYCEDESAQAKFLKNKIDQWALQNKIEVNIDLYISAEEFQFKAFIENYDLIFLDISMTGMDGMELARWIRQRNQEVVIVFVTSDPSFVFQGYEVGAYRYLLKPIEYDKLTDILTYVENKFDDKSENNIIIKIENENRKINLNEIIYIEVQGHYVIIHMDNEKSISLKSSFEQIMKKLNENTKLLYATHRSYAVNINKVKRISRTECVLDSGETLPVSRTASHELNEAFIQVIKQQM